MAKVSVLSIDAMGGDNAPGSVVDGVALAARAAPEDRFLLHGDAARLAPLLAAHPGLSGQVEILHTDTQIPMDAKPSQAMRRGKGSSMWNAIQAVKDGQAVAAVSAGNTGALMAIAMLILRQQPGVQRPALACSWPNANGISSVLDVGANVSADANMLVEFAIMGEAFHRAVHGIARPRIGLLNVGSEDEKGHAELRAAAGLFRERLSELDFFGYVEGDDLAKGTTDVVVTDGFTGNVALKTAEGTAKFVAGLLKSSFSRSPLHLAVGALASFPLASVKQAMDPRRYNGGPLLGLNGLVIKSHGSTDGLGYANAIKVATRLAESSYRDEIAANLAKLGAAGAPVEAPAGTSP